MKSLANARLAASVVVLILSLFVLMHLLVLLGIVPYGMVWGGKIESRPQMLRYETIALLITLLMILPAGISAGFLKFRVAPIILRIAFWIMAAIFLLNTLGNAMSEHPLERWMFTPLTFLLALCCLRLALAKEYGRQAGYIGRLNQK